MTEELITPRDLLRKYRTALFDHDREARTHLEREGRHLRCERGCAFCCYAKILTDLGEGALIYLFLKATGQWSPALERRLAEADAAMTSASHSEWLPLRRPCVFLKEEAFGRGLCQVHPARPHSCASAFSVGDPVECGKVDGQPGFLRYLNEGAAKSFMGLFASIDAGLGQEPQGMTLPGAVLYAHALIEEIPLPVVHAVPALEMAAAARAGGDLDFGSALFDQTARRRS